MAIPGNGAALKVVAGAAIGVCVALGGGTVAAYAAFFRDAVPRDELVPIVATQQQNGRDISNMKGVFTTKVEAIEDKLVAVEKQLDGMDRKLDQALAARDK